ncbi:hypothetical protein OEZ85_000755 [Tetradesmus obliquus]|uniref:ADP-ribosylation factor-like protein 16 n=1 Tax=Tetradesmus obliquus TaxID=3088 RepID=A0ABY8UKA3_TETOB|nr:hypothetical protein OEZ85_000755 [Tetradesmus obliquus]
MCSCLCSEPDAWLEAAATVLTVGLQGSGKSVLLGQIAAHHARRTPLLQGPGSAAAVAPLPPPDTMPTTGTELLKLPPVKGGLLPRGVILREVGGQMQPIWHHYYEEAAAVLFVVDAAQPSRLADSAMLLFDLLQDPQLQDKPMCVLLNKRDQPDALSQSQLDTVLRLHDLRLSHPGRLQVLAVSGLCGQGLSELMKWLAAAAAAAAAAAVAASRKPKHR